VRVDLLLTLAGVDNQLGAYAEAQALLDRAAPAVDRLAEPSGELSLRARRLRAQALLGEARPAEARALLEPIGDALTASAADVEALIVLATALSGDNRADDAQPVFARARTIAEALPDGADALVQRVDIARVESLVYAQKFADGLALADAAWNRWKAGSREPSRDILNLLAATSVAAEGTGNLARAEAAYRDAIGVAERLYVRPHPDTAWVIGVYGSFLVAAARFDEAEPYVERALSMRRALLGEAHPDTLNAIAAMGRLRSGQMRRTEARQIFSEGVAICEREGVRHNVCPRLLGSLAQILLAEGEIDEASRTATKAVAMQRTLTGAESPQMIATLGFLARVQVRQRAYEPALATTGEALRIAERAGSGDSKDARYARFQRALALYGLGRNDEALALAANVVAEQKAKTPDEKTSLFSMLALEARALARAGRAAEARTVAEEALAIERKPRPLDEATLAELERLAGTRAITASKRD
jgi:serine/threonine-protein kinase